MKEKQFKSLQEFYPFYLTEHQNKTSRNLHFIGTLFLFFILGVSIYFGAWNWLILIPIVGYGFAWIGHAFFEKNKPATFKYPLFSLASDFIMFKDILTDKLDEKMKEAKRKIEKN